MKYNIGTVVIALALLFSTTAVYAKGQQVVQPYNNTSAVEQGNGAQTDCIEQDK